MNISSIGIISYGQFGQFIHVLCKEYFPDVEVLISSRSYADAVPLEEACKADIVFPCGPIKYMKEQLEQIIPLLGEHSILWEVTTVKVMPENILKKYPDIQYICSHPMFGPESYKKNNASLAGCTLAWCSDSLDAGIRETIVGMLTGHGLRMVYLTADEHDKDLAGTLFLTHYVSQIVYQAGFDRSDIDTLSFGYLMDAVESVKDNVELFKDVWKFNSYCKEVVEQFAKTNEEIVKGLNL